MKVVDASVVLQWLLEDPAAKSQRVLEAHLAGIDGLVAPDLLDYEVANVLGTKTRLKMADAVQAFEHYLALDITTYSLGGEELQHALQLAYEHKLTVYDASYLALAFALKTRFVTADHRLAARGAGLGIFEVV